MAHRRPQLSISYQEGGGAAPPAPLGDDGTRVLQKELHIDGLSKRPPAYPAEEFYEARHYSTAPHRARPRSFIVYGAAAVSPLQVARTANVVRSRGFTQVALQFPDALLPDAFTVVRALRRMLATLPARVGPAGAHRPNDESNCLFARRTVQAVKVFVLGDTSYGSCGVDEVAARGGSGRKCIAHPSACCNLANPARAPPAACRLRSWWCALARCRHSI